MLNIFLLWWPFAAPATPTAWSGWLYSGWLNCGKCDSSTTSCSRFSQKCEEMWLVSLCVTEVAHICLLPPSANRRSGLDSVVMRGCIIVQAYKYTFQPTRFKSQKALLWYCSVELVSPYTLGQGRYRLYLFFMLNTYVLRLTMADKMFQVLRANQCVCQMWHLDNKFDCGCWSVTSQNLIKE